MPRWRSTGCGRPLTRAEQRRCKGPQKSSALSQLQACRSRLCGPGTSIARRYKASRPGFREAYAKLWQLVKPQRRNHSSCVAYPHAQWFQFEMLNSPWGTFERTRLSCSNPCTFTATSLEPLLRAGAKAYAVRRKLQPTGSASLSREFGQAGEFHMPRAPELLAVLAAR